MKNKSAEIPTKPKFKKSTFLLAAIAQLHFGSKPDVPIWAKNARAQFLDSFIFLSKKSEFYRHGYKQAMWDMMFEELAKQSQEWAAMRRKEPEQDKIDEYLPHELRKSTDSDKRDYYTGKADARDKFCDGGLSPRQKCFFFMSTNHKCFEGLTQKEARQIFVELKFITSNTDESQTRQWLGEIGFRSGQRGRPAKPKR
jgi:hypothetical protein